MILLENITEGLHSIKANPLRSTLTLIGIAVGIGAVLYVVTLGEMTKQRIAQRLEAMGPNILIIRPEFAHGQGVHVDVDVVSLTWDDARQLAATSGVITETVPVFSGNASAEYRDKNRSTRVTGTTSAWFPVNNAQPSEGRVFTPQELLDRARVCVIGATVRKDLFGNESPIGKTIFLKSNSFTVTGILPAKGESWSSPDDQIFVPLTTAQERMMGVDYLNTVMAQMRSADCYEEALYDIESLLRQNHRLRADQPNDFRVRRQDFFLSTIQETNVELANFIIIIALVSLVVGGIGIANVMLVSVTERTREIGIRRAVGASRLMIVLQFIIESVVLGVSGGCLGILGGLLLNRMLIEGTMVVPWLWIGNSIVICVGVGAAAGFYPALRAARFNIIDALRYE
ncbi:MAG: ABC transporter permease [Candidatus Zixiibacteriota bacterium]